MRTNKEKRHKKSKVPKESNCVGEDEELCVDMEFKLGAVVTFIVSCCFYGVTMFPGLPMGDSGEFVVTSLGFGVSHPPGYPMFTVFSYFAINIIPFGSPAWRISMLSVIFGACFNMTIYYIVSLLGKNCMVGFLTAGWVGFSRLFWMWSIQGEVFSLNNFFCAYIMLRAYYFENSKRENIMKEAKLSALTCGFSLSNQHTSVLFIIPFAVRVAYKVIVLDRRTFKEILGIVIYGLAGMAWYLQLPMSYFFFKPKVTWGEFGSVGTFLQHILRLDYGSSFKLVAGDSKGTFFTNFATFVKDSASELSIITWLFIIFLFARGLSNFSKTIAKTITVISLMLLCYLAVFCSLANIDNPVGLSRGILERFWMQPSIVLSVLGGVGLCSLLRYLSENVHSGIKNKILQGSFAVLIVSIRIKNNFHENDESRNMYAYHYADAILSGLPNNSIMLSGGDLPTNVFRYHTICENIRPDVFVMDMQFMASDWLKSVLAPVTFPGINIPGTYRPFLKDKLRTGQYNLDMFLDLNIDQYPIYICNAVRQDDLTYQDNYMLIPYKTCKRFYRRSSVKNPVELLEDSAGTVLYEWPMPSLLQYEDRTWEDTLMKTYLLSLGEKGLLLWDEAIRTKHPENRRYLLEHGLHYMNVGTLQVEAAIDKGILPETSWTYLAEHIAKNQGHFCMIVRSMLVADTSTSREEKQGRLSELDTCVRKYWKLYILWFAPGEKGDPYITEIKRMLRLESFDGLKFNI